MLLEYQDGAIAADAPAIRESSAIHGRAVIGEFVSFQPKAECENAVSHGAQDYVGVKTPFEQQVKGRGVEECPPSSEVKSLALPMTERLE